MNEWIKFGKNFSRNVIPDCAVSMTRNGSEVFYFDSGNQISSERAIEIIDQYNKDLVAGTFEQKILKSASEEFDAFCLELEGARFITV